MYQASDVLQRFLEMNNHKIVLQNPGDTQNKLLMDNAHLIVP